MNTKKKLMIFMLSLFLLLGLPWTNSRRSVAQAGQGSEIAQGLNVSLSLFNQLLSPYGNWVDTSYGPSWQPANVDVNWQPYSNGNWVYTDYGWTWNSNDPWGDVTYRYGSWTNDPQYGWVWVPGYTWAPSWVTWQYTDNSVGWAPIPPDYSFDVGYNDNYGYGYYNQPLVTNYDNYVFVPIAYLTSPSLYGVRYPRYRNRELYHHGHPVTTFGLVNGYIANTGPRFSGYERYRQNRVSHRQAFGNNRWQPQPARFGQGHRVQAASPELNRRDARQVPMERRNVKEQNRIDRRQQQQPLNNQQLQQQQPRSDRQQQMNNRQQQMNNQQQMRQNQMINPRQQQMQNIREQQRLQQQQMRQPQQQMRQPQQQIRQPQQHMQNIREQIRQPQMPRTPAQPQMRPHR